MKKLFILAVSLWLLGVIFLFYDVWFVRLHHTAKVGFGFWGLSAVAAFTGLVRYKRAWPLWVLSLALACGSMALVLWIAFSGPLLPTPS